MAYFVRLLLAAIATVGALIALVWLWCAAIAGSPRAWRLILACDQLFNAAGGGDPRETVSSRAGKAKRQGARWACVLCRLLDVINSGHCDNTIDPAVGEKIEFL